jgi:hypothetical protein
MKQTTKTLVSLGGFIVLALVLATAAAWVGRDEEQKTQAKEKSAKLFELDKAKVRELELKKGGVLLAHLKRESATAPWKLTAPVQTEAEDSAAAAIVDKLESLKQKTEVEGLDPKTVGLGDEGKTRFAITVTEEGGKAQTLLVGEDQPFDQTVYVKKPGDKVIRLIPAADKAPFDKELFDLRDKRVAHVDEAAQIKKIEVTPVAVPGVKAGSKPAKGAPVEPAALAYAIEHEGADWKLLSPAAGAADSATGEKVINVVKGLRTTKIAAESVPEGGLALFGLDAPKLTVTLTVLPPGGKETFQRKVMIGQPSRDAAGALQVKTYAKRDDSGAVFEVDQAVLKDLEKSLFDLQDKTVVRFDREAVRKLEYKGGGAGYEELTVARKKDAPADGGTAEESFEVVAPKQGLAKKWKLSGNLFSLSGMKAAAFGDAAPTDPKVRAKLGLDQARTVTLLGDGDKVLARLWVGAEIPAGADGKKRRHVAVEGAARTFEVETASLDDLPKTVDDALEPPPSPPPAPVMTLPDAGAK